MVGEALDVAVKRLSSRIAAPYGLEKSELLRIIGDHIFEARERLADEMEESLDVST